MSVYIIPSFISGSDVTHVVHPDYHAGTAHLCEGAGSMTAKISREIRAVLVKLRPGTAEALCPGCCDRVGIGKERVVTIARLREL